MTGTETEQPANGRLPGAHHHLLRLYSPPLRVSVPALSGFVIVPPYPPPRSASYFGTLKKKNIKKTYTVGTTH